MSATQAHVPQITGNLSSPPSNALRARIGTVIGRQITFIPNRRFSASRSFRECDLEMVRHIEQGSASVTSVRTPRELPAHYARMVQVPLLSADEESVIFERMNYCKFRAERIRSRLRPDMVSESEIAEFDDMIERSERLRNYLLQANTRLVMSIARKFADARNPFDDLLSQGITSLMQAAEKFDFDRGYRFSTYATCAIRRDLSRTVVTTGKRRRRFASGTTELLDDVVQAPDVQQSPQTQVASYERLRSVVGKIMECLDDRERAILSARFGFDLNDGPKKTSYSQLGTSLGISKERVRQLANRALDKLRDLAPEHDLERYLDEP